MEKEIWKCVDGCNGLYRVSSLGGFESCINVGNHKPDGVWRRKVPNKRKNGYFVVSIVKNGVSRLEYLHRIVAQAFCSNPNGYKEIDHIDSDKSNNKASNLRWVTHKENLSNPHAQNERLRIAKKRGISVQQYKLDGSFVREYYSLREVERVNPNINRERVKQCANGELPQVCGYLWRFSAQEQTLALDI